MNTEKIVFEQGNKQVIQKGTHFFTRVTEGKETFESGDFNTLERAKQSLGILSSITENNKKIAEFIGAKIKGNPILNEYEMYGIIECIEDGENEQHHFIPQEMKFNTSWDWLMEVVEKIEGLTWNNEENKDGLYTWTPQPFKILIIGEHSEICLDGITNKSSKVIDNKKYSFYETGFTNNKKEAVYKAVIAFIDWYNENGAKEN